MIVAGQHENVGKGIGWAKAGMEQVTHNKRSASTATPAATAAVQQSNASPAAAHLRGQWSPGWSGGTER